VDCLRNDLDELLICFRYRSEAERRRVRTTNAIERRFREVRRRTRPMGTFQDITSMDRILFSVFTHENKMQGVGTPFLLTQTKPTDVAEGKISRAGAVRPSALHCIAQEISDSDVRRRPGSATSGNEQVQQKPFTQS